VIRQVGKTWLHIFNFECVHRVSKLALHVLFGLYLRLSISWLRLTRIEFVRQHHGRGCDTELIWGLLFLHFEFVDLIFRFGYIYLEKAISLRVPSLWKVTKYDSSPTQTVEVMSMSVTPTSLLVLFTLQPTYLQESLVN